MKDGVLKVCDDEHPDVVSPAMMIREWTRKMMDQRNIILRARWISSCRRGELFVAGDNREGRILSILGRD